jgi:O-acetyl-ADP-ribose deacetylase (regulator of RNase III)
VNDFAVRLSLAGGKLLDLHGPADITKEATDAIVNAANSYLLGGGGVDGAIHRAGGPAILQECKAIVAQFGLLPAGKAVMTTGGRLAAKYVIHTVDPIYGQRDGREPETLASCYQESIRLADDHAVRSVAFPSVSTGAFGYPVHEAAQVAVSATIGALASTVHVMHARFVLFDIATVKAYSAAVEKLHKAGTISPLRIEKGSLCEKK